MSTNPEPPTGADILVSLGLETLIADQGFVHDPATGTLGSPLSGRVVAGSQELLRSLHKVLDGDPAGGWAAAMKSSGYRWGKKFAAELDARLTVNEKPPLAGLPLEACLVFLAHHFARHGFGTLKLDLTRAAEHGVVVATLADSFMASAAGSAHDFADPLPAGLIQGFFEHISGQELGCEEIACAHLGAPECTFVITAPERIDSIRGMIGLEPAAAIIDRLCT